MDPARPLPPAVDDPEARARIERAAGVLGVEYVSSRAYDFGQSSVSLPSMPFQSFDPGTLLARIAHSEFAMLIEGEAVSWLDAQQAAAEEERCQARLMRQREAAAEVLLGEG